MNNQAEAIQAFEQLNAVAPEFFEPINNNDDLQRLADFLANFDRMKGEAPHPLDPLAEALMLRIVAYENEHHPINTDDIPGAEMLGFLMEQRGLTQQQLAKETGIPQPTISKILSGKREINASHARAFGKYFNFDPGFFI